MISTPIFFKNPVRRGFAAESSLEPYTLPVNETGILTLTLNREFYFLTNGDGSLILTLLNLFDNGFEPLHVVGNQLRKGLSVLEG